MRNSICRISTAASRQWRGSWRSWVDEQKTEDRSQKSEDLRPFRPSGSPLLTPVYLSSITKDNLDPAVPGLHNGNGFAPATRHAPGPTPPGISRALDGSVFRPPDPGCAHHSDWAAPGGQGSQCVRRPVAATGARGGSADFEMFRHHPGGGGFGLPSPARGGLPELLVRGADRLEPVHHSFVAGSSQSLSY